MGNAIYLTDDQLSDLLDLVSNELEYLDTRAAEDDYTPAEIKAKRERLDQLMDSLHVEGS